MTLSGSLDQMTQLFERNKSTISRHIKNVFEEDELLLMEKPIRLITTIKADGTVTISNGTPVALTLLIAESKPEEKEIMVRGVMNILRIN